MCYTHLRLALLARVSCSIEVSADGISVMSVKSFSMSARASSLDVDRSNAA